MLLLLLRGLCLFAMAPSGLHGQLAKALRWQPCTELQASDQSKRNANPGRQSKIHRCNKPWFVTFSRSFLRVVFGKGASPKHLSEGHHFVRTCTFTLYFGLSGKQQPFFAMFLGYKVIQRGRRPACAPFHVMLSTSKGAHTARAARTGLPDLAANRLARSSPSPRRWLHPQKQTPPAHAAVTSILAASNPTGTRTKSHRHTAPVTSALVAIQPAESRQSRSSRQFSRQAARGLQHLPLPRRWLQVSRHTHRQSRSSRQFSRQAARSAISPPAALARYAANSAHLKHNHLRCAVNSAKLGTLETGHVLGGACAVCCKLGPAVCGELGTLRSRSCRQFSRQAACSAISRPVAFTRHAANMVHFRPNPCRSSLPRG